MRTAAAGLAVLATLSAAAPARQEKRQNLSDLLQLATEAAIPVPTDPAVLLSLGPVAAQLASHLPTSPVLEALESAAPPGFLSRVVHDPEYAASFESAFAAGESPSWFLALPTDVRSYLHTYDGLPAVATELNSAEGVLASASASASARPSATRPTVYPTGGGSNGTSNGTATATSSGGGISAGGSAGGSEPTASPPAPSSTSASTGAAPRHTGVLAAGAVAAGVLGFAAVL